MQIDHVRFRLPMVVGSGDSSADLGVVNYYPTGCLNPSIGHCIPHCLLVLVAGIPFPLDWVMQIGHLRDCDWLMAHNHCDLRFANYHSLPKKVHLGLPQIQFQVGFAWYQDAHL